jgi:hypothetical protein
MRNPTKCSNRGAKETHQVTHAASAAALATLRMLQFQNKKVSVRRKLLLLMFLLLRAGSLWKSSGVRAERLEGFSEQFDWVPANLCTLHKLT